MIKDKLENIGRYSQLEKLKSFVIEQYAKGRFEIGESNCFGIGLEYETKDSSEGLWEAHVKHLDVHLILEGEEEVHISNIESCQPTMEYDAENDYRLYNAEVQDRVQLKKGDFLALYPEEVHKTGVVISEASSVKKIVFKIELPI